MSEKKAKPVKEDDLTSRIIAGLRAIAPKKAGGAHGLLEVGRSSKSVLAKVTHVLMTGLSPFDDLTGAIPFGKVVEIYGLENCGKTSLALKLAIQGQLKNIAEVTTNEAGHKVYTPIDHKDYDVSVLYLDNESSLNDDEKTMVDGVAMDVAIARCDTVDMMFKVIERAIDERDKKQKESTRQQLLIVIVDTVASTSSKEELSQEWGKDDYSRQAKQLRRGFRILSRRISRSNVCAIFTNQVSDKFGDAGVKGRPKTVNPSEGNYDGFGGKALRYYSTHRIFMFRLMSKYRVNRKSQFADGYLVGFYTTKNRLKKPCREGRLVLSFDEQRGGFNDNLSKLETLIYLKAAEVGETGVEITFKFSRFGIEPKTFTPAKKSLDQEDDDEEASPTRRRRDPSIEGRMFWEKFYVEHRTDLDTLWQAAVQRAFADRQTEPEPEVDDDNADESEEEED